MQRELRNALQDKLKTAVMDALYDAVPVELPSSLINNEIQHLLKPYVENAKKQKINLEDLKLPKEVFEAQAKRRVALGLILAQIIRTHNLTVDAAKVRSTIEDLAQSYEDASEVIDWYYADKTRLADIEQLVLENQTVEWIVNQAKVTDQTISFDVAMSKDSQINAES